MKRERTRKYEPVLLERHTQVREVWPYEEPHFTPWLSEPENLEALSHVTDLNLDFNDTESYVSKFNVPKSQKHMDIVCTDLRSNGGLVVIENQLEDADHQHLGQLLCYLSLIDANTAIWVAPRFSDDFRHTVCYLNSVTGTKLKIYAVRINAWVLSDDRAGATFDVVASPSIFSHASVEVTNPFSKKEHEGTPKANSVATAEESAVSVDSHDAGEESSKEEREMSALESRLSRYWERFLDSHGASLPLKPDRTPQPKTFLTMGIGHKEMHINGAIIRTRHEVQVQLYIYGQNPASHLEQLKKRSVEIEKKLGYSLVWGNPASTVNQMIYCSLQQSQYDNESGWDCQHEWLAEKMRDFHRVFKEAVQTLNTEVQNQSQ